MNATMMQPTPIEKQKRRVNPKLLVISAVLLVVVGFLVFNALGSSMAYYQTISELEASGKTTTGERVRVGGDVVPGTIQRTGLSDEIRFTITDGTATMDVVYSQIVPDIFKDGVQVVAEGHVDSNGVFQADSLLTKCPSRFEAEGTAAT